MADAVRPIRSITASLRHSKSVGEEGNIWANDDGEIGGIKEEEEEVGSLKGEGGIKARRPPGTVGRRTDTESYGGYFSLRRKGLTMS